MTSHHAPEAWAGTKSHCVPSFHAHTKRKNGTTLTHKQSTPRSISNPPIQARTVGNGTLTAPNPAAAYIWRSCDLPITSPYPPCPMSILAIMPRRTHWARHAQVRVTRGTVVITASQEVTVVPKPCIHSMKKGTPKL